MNAFTRNDFQRKFIDYLEQNTFVKRLVIALSSGSDSTALLHLLVQLRNDGLLADREVCAVHFNHNWNPDYASTAQSFCEQQCAKYAVPLEVVVLDNQQPQTEQKARQLRYLELTRLHTSTDVVLMAHTRDDQTETFLLRQLRGAGISGLASIPLTRRLGNAGAHLYRPLLDSSKQELRAYLKQNNKAWLEDPSNQDLGKDRNFLRLTIIPLLEARFGQVGQRLQHSIQAIQEVKADIDEVAIAFLNEQLDADGSVAIAALQQLSPAVLQNVIGRWTFACAIAAQPSHATMMRIKERLPQWHTNISIQWKDAELRARNKRLYLKAIQLDTAQPRQPLPCA